MKTSAQHSDGSGLLYRGPFVYGRSASGTLTFGSAAFAGGRITSAGVQYHVTDHLRSVVAVVKGSDGTVVESGKYADFGSRTDIVSAGTPTAATNRWHFSGKEDQEVDFDLPYTDFGARLYNPDLGRWIAPDPASEKYFDISPYAYCANNPVNLVDPDGENLTDYYDLRGNLVLHIDDGNDDKYLLLENTEVLSAINNGAIFPVPSEAVIQTMDDSYEITERTGNEAGFQVDINGISGPIGEGNKSHVVIPFVYNETGAYAAYEVHTHPNPTPIEGLIQWCDCPSTDDINSSIGNYPSIVLGYNASSAKSMAFYNSTGQVGNPVSYRRFKKIVRKINKMTE